MKKRNLILLLILLLGIVLRVYGFFWGLPNEDRHHPYSPDESNLIWSLRNMQPERLNFNPGYLNNPTFFYYLSGAAIKVASLLGWVNIVNSERYYFDNPMQYRRIHIIPRLLSMLMGILTIYLTYLCAREVFDESVGMLSALFLALSPTHIVNSRLMTLGVPVTFWMMLAFYFAIRVIKDGKTKNFLLLGLVAGLAISTKYTASILLLIIFITYLLIEKTKEQKRLIPKLLLAYIAVFVAIFLTSPYIFLDYNLFLDGFLRGNLRHFISEDIWQASKFLFYLVNPTYNFFYGIGPFLLLMSLAGVFYTAIKKKKTRFDILLLSWVVIYYILFVKATHYATDRRFLPIIPIFMILSAGLYKQYLARHNLIVGRAILIMATSFTLLYSILVDISFASPPPQEVASDWIKENIADNSSIGITYNAYYLLPDIISKGIKAKKAKFIKYDYNYILEKVGVGDLKKGGPEYLIVTTHKRDINRREVPPNYYLLREFKKKIPLIDNFINPFFTKEDLFFNHTIYIFKKG